MNKEEMKNKYAVRAKIFQQAMESCKSSSPMDCIEWFADRIAELEKAYNETEELLDKQIEATYKVVEENKKSNVLFADIIEAFTSCSYNDDFEMAQAGKEIYELFYGGKDPKEVFHNAEVPKSSRQLLKEAKELIRNLLRVTYGEGWNYSLDWKVKAEDFLKECE